MNSLLSLKDWFTLDETVRYLWETINQKLLKSDLISLIRDEKITLTAKVATGTKVQVMLPVQMKNSEKKHIKFYTTISAKTIYLNNINTKPVVEMLSTLTGSAFSIKLPSFFIDKTKPIKTENKNHILNAYNEFVSQNLKKYAKVGIFHSSVYTFSGLKK